MIKDKEYQNKAILPSEKNDKINVVQKQDFAFPTYGIIISANNLAEAQELLQKQIKNKTN